MPGIPGEWPMLDMGILPHISASGSHRLFVDQFQEPADVAVKPDVVVDLDVERLGAAFEEQTRERVTMLMPGSILVTFADDADKRRVAAVAGHEVTRGSAPRSSRSHRVKKMPAPPARGVRGGREDPALNPTAALIMDTTSRFWPPPRVQLCASPCTYLTASSLVA
jgi:hypothetical protein